MTKIRYKRWQIFLTLLSLIVVASSFYFQYVEGLQPCPLCLMQRLCACLLFAICFISIWSYYLRTGKFLAILQIIFAVLGLYFASRQLWLQSLPEGQAPACMPELDILIRYLPLKDILRTLFLGTGDCAHVSWNWLGFSMPAWAAFYFLFMLFSGIIIFWRLNVLKITTTP